MLEYRVAQLEESLEHINEHGTKPVLMLRADVSRWDDRMRSLEANVEEVPLLRQDVLRYAETFKAMRTSIYSVAATIVVAAILILVLGGGH